MRHWSINEGGVIVRRMEAQDHADRTPMNDDDIELIQAFRFEQPRHNVNHAHRCTWGCIAGVIATIGIATATLYYRATQGEKKDAQSAPPPASENPDLAR